MTGAVLSPSETVYLHAEAFAREGTLLDSVEVLHREGKVRAGELARAILAATVLGAEAQGAIRLEARERSKWLGMRKERVLHLARAGGAPLPPGSLEAALVDALANGEAEARPTLAAILRQDANNTALLPISRVQEGLASRGILGAEEKTRLKVFKKTEYAMTDATREARDNADPAAVQALLTKTREGRPELWALLERALNGALDDRQAQQDWDGPD